MTGQLSRDEYDLVASINAELLERLLVPLDAISDEYLVTIDEGGLYVNGVDPANVVMADVDAPAEVFDSIEGDPVEFGVYVGDLLEYLERVDSTVQVGVDADGNELVLVSDPYRFELGTIRAGSVRDHSEVPTLEGLTCEISLPSNEFQSAVEYATWCTDYLRLQFDPDDGVFSVTAEGDTQMATFELSEESIDVLEDGPADTLFSGDFASDLADGLPESQPVTIRVGEEFPMITTYEVPASSVAETATVQLLLAPRIVDDSE